MSDVSVITIAHGRHEHWLKQQDALDRSSCDPADRILVVVDDDELADLARDRAPEVTVTSVDSEGGALPLARARNAGARQALEHESEVLVFLDVDCIPAPRLVGAYADAATRQPWHDHILAGPVTYLPPPPDDGYDLMDLAAVDNPHPNRPAPLAGEISRAVDHDMFWSLSFAASASTWTKIGGFHEEYVGYGAEDTDFARTARARGVPMAWVGSARAYHQYHRVGDPPVEHARSIVRNARLFNERWGDWPMKPWLDALVEDGHVVVTEDGEYRLSDNASA